MSQNNAVEESKHAAQPSASLPAVYAPRLPA